MALLRLSVLKNYLSPIREHKMDILVSEDAEWMDYFNQQIAQTDKQIDGMVYGLYGLYGLSEEEVRVVMNSTK